MTHIDTSIINKKRIANFSLLLLVATIIFGLFQARKDLVIRLSDFADGNKNLNNITYKTQHPESKNSEILLYNNTLQNSNN